MSDERIPARNPKVPADARWDAKESVWLSGREEGGQRVGPYRSYREDGTLARENGYTGGKSHGPYKRFHENGEVSQQGEMFEAQRNGLCLWLKSTADTTEHTIPQGCADTIWRAQRVYQKGLAEPAHFFTKDGTEVTTDGTPVPPKPAGLPENATYWPDDDTWFFGRIAKDDANLRVGKWTWWTREGILQTEHVYPDEGGREVLERKYHENGKLFVERRYTPTRKQTYVAYFGKDGHPRSRIEHTYDGDRLMTSVAYGDNDVLVHRGKRGADGMEYDFFHPNGKVQAKGTFNDKGAAVGVWHFFGETGEETHAIDLAPFKLKGYRLDEDFEPEWLLGRALLDTAMKAPRPKELAGVDEIEWGEVEGCFGDDVADFPALLTAMTSSEPAARRSALGSIENETLHQGSVYAATARVLPFLVRLLDHPNADKVDVLKYAYSVACSASPYLEEVKELEEDERFPIEGTANAVASAWATFERFLDDGDAALRESALLLAAFAERNVVKGALEKVARQDPAPRLRAVAVQALLALDGSEPADAVSFLTHEDPVLRLVAAVSSGRRFGPKAPKGTVDVLKQSFETFEALRERYEELPFVGDHILADISIGMGSIRDEAARSFAKTLASRLDEVGALSSLPYARGLLALSFGNGDRPYAPAFLDILEKVGQSKPFYEYVNCNEVLDAWALPRGKGALLELASELRKAADPEAAMYEKMHAGEDEGKEEDEEEEEEDS